MSHEAVRPTTSARKMIDLRDGALHAQLPSLAVDLAVHRRQGRLQALHELVPRGDVCRLALPGIVQREHASGDGADIALDAADAVCELEGVGRKPGRPAIQPVVHHLLGERELLLGRGIAAEVAPDHLGLVEHGVFDVRVRPRVGQALTQSLQRAALERVGPNGLNPHEQGGEDHHGETQKQLALEAHGSNSSADAGVPP